MQVVTASYYDRVMKQFVYNPSISGEKMTIVCFVSGSGTNYREVVSRNPAHRYVVFSNRPDCGGVAIARENNHEVLELSHIPYLRGARKRFGPGNVPRNAPERIEYEQEVCRLIESSIGGEPDLICMAGYDQWNTDWMVDKYYPRILNVHPGDTTKGYAGLGWIPSAMAILAGDEAIRSTLFFVDKGKDDGPVLVQSEPLNIALTLEESASKGHEGLMEGFRRITSFAAANELKTFAEFKEKAGEELLDIMANICKHLQDEIKVKGDWKIYPFAIHDLIARGRVQEADRTVYIDDKKMPEYGYRIDEYE
ncbi:formyltransferase family protein [Chloroflexota bacterium]